LTKEGYAERTSQLSLADGVVRGANNSLAEAAALIDREIEGQRGGICASNDVDQFSGLGDRNRYLLSLIGAIAADHGQRRFEKDLQIEPDRLLPDIPQIHSHHFIERRAAPTGHPPLARDTRLYFKDSAPVP
jgi:hypothetical protein